MRFHGLTLLATVAVLGACGGGEKAATDTATTAAATPAASTPAAATPAGNPSGAAPITGQTHVVKMLQDDQGNYKYDPANLTIKAGDGVKFVMVSGGTHNVAFDPANVPVNAKGQLTANMTGQISELSGPMLMTPNEEYVLSFGNIPAGKYEFHCTPHLAMGMKGTITVQ
jgi:plastocyanin